MDVDNVQAAIDATSYLIQKGHRQIAFFKGDDVLLSSQQREAGYRQALAAAGLAVEERLIFPGGYQVESGCERMQFLLGQPECLWPSAIFCGDDFIAQGARQALLEKGLQVPADMSLIGVNDDKEVSLLGTGLTTVRQPLNEFGECAVKMVLHQIEQKSGVDQKSDGEKVLIHGTLIERGSVGPPCR